MASSSGARRKRDASLELGGPVLKMSKTEKAAEKNKLQSKRGRREKQSANKNDISKDIRIPSGIASAIKSTHTSGLHKALRVLNRVVDRNLPNLLEELDSAKLLAFHDMETEFQQEDAEEFVVCLDGRFPDICELRSTLIVGLHKSLRSYKRSNVLLPHDLYLFLELSHDRVDEDYDLNQDIIDDEVANVLHDIKIINKTKVPAVEKYVDEEVKAMTLMAALDTVQQSLRQAQEDVEGVATKLKHARMSHTLSAVKGLKNDKFTLEDILDPNLRKDVVRLQTIYGARWSVGEVHEALTEYGNFDDANAHLSAWY